jgi:Flp pilus assembly protein TadD
MQRLAILLCLSAAPHVFAAKVELNLGHLSPSLRNLKRADQTTIERAVTLIKKGQHTAAFAQLTEISRAHPNNSAVRVVLAYALLQAGNLAGAFDQAQQAEAASDHTSYACLFLARIAYLIGDTAVCRRELDHVIGSGEHVAEAKRIERDLARAPAAAPKR